VNELVATERSYVRSLSIVEEVFVEPLVAQKTLPAESISLVFSNIRSILILHVKLLEILEDRCKKWITFPIGDIFLNLMGEFKELYTIYVNGWNYSSEMLERCLEIKDFETFLWEAHKNKKCNLLELSDFLIMPVQRLPRYALLLEDIFKNTDAHDKDFPEIKEAIKQIKGLTQSINEKKRESDSVSRIQEMKNKVRGKSTNYITQPGRVLRREGLLIAVGKGNKGEQKERSVYLFLFNDMILSSKQTSVRKRVFDQTMRYDEVTSIQLKGAFVGDLDSKDEQLTSDPSLYFKLIDAAKKTYVIKSENVSSKKGWITDIKDAINSLTL